jgi:NAD+ kinase
MLLFGSVHHLSVPEPRLLVVSDPHNKVKTFVAKEELEKYAHRHPNLIAVVGGDGFMLHTIRRLWHRRLPFFGVNVGHRGFLLNEPTVIKRRFPEEVALYHLPFLEVEAELESGRVKRMLGFNDAWVERAKSQTAWIEVKINSTTRLRRLVADGALVSTPAGSTAYAMAMGASPLPLDAQTLVLVGANVSQPHGFKPCYLPLGSEIEFVTCDPVKRPMIGVVDGLRQGRVKRFRVTVSKMASVELAFAGKHNLTEKLAGIQFPRESE